MTDKQDQKWFSIEITVDASASEAVEFAYNELGSAGTEINNLRKKRHEPVTVIGYFNDLPSDSDLAREIENAFRIYQIGPDLLESIRFHDIADADWLAEWKKHWRPTTIGKFIIAPPWEVVEEAAGIVIKIEPNMAFGTGTHETTQLCLTAISDLYRAEQSFLDVGTGTGILAIAAAKIASANVSEDSLVSKITGYEIDKESVRIARENAVLNGAGENIEFIDGPVSANCPAFDFVCANLTLDVIVPILDSLIEKANERLVLSGILESQQDEIVSKLTELGIKSSEINKSGEWIAVVIEMPLIEIG